MNKSVYIITTTTTLLFLIGFLFVRAANKSNLTPMKFGISLNAEPIEMKDTLSIYSTDLISFEYFKKTGDESITEWTINDESKSLSDAFEYTFKEAGTYKVKASNPRAIASEFIVVVESPEIALLKLEGGPHHRIGQLCTIIDETPEVKKRQWVVNGKSIGDESEVLKFKPTDSGLQKIKVISRLENGKLAVAEVKFEVESLASTKPAERVSGGGGGGGGALAAGSGTTLTNRITNLGYPVSMDDSQFAIASSKDGKKLFEATLTASSKMNLTQFAIKGKNRSGKISISVLDSKGQIIETKQLDCKPQNLYISLNDGSGIDLKANEVLKIWLEIDGGAEIASVANKSNSGFKPYPGFDITFEKDVIWMYDIEVWTP
jgi:hypothetical protein